MDPSRAPVAFGRLSVPQLFGELQQQREAEGRMKVLRSICDLVHDPERVYRTVNGGFVDQLKVPLEDEDESVRSQTCELLHLLTAHTIGRQALLSSSLLPHLSQLLDDSSSSCRINILRVLNRLVLLPRGADAVLPLVPNLIQKLRQREKEEEEEVLLLSTLNYCSRLNPLPALSCNGVQLLGTKLSHQSVKVRREAAAAMMALSVPMDGKVQVCEEEDVLPLLVSLLVDGDIEVQTNAVGVIMNTVIITAGKRRCLDLNVLPILVNLLSEEEEQQQEEEKRRKSKALFMYSLRALTALADAPQARHLLLRQLPLLERRSGIGEKDWDVRRAALTAVKVVNWRP
ncbi:radial spoke head 14 homolog [Pholidichthys leucotaenia]